MQVLLIGCGNIGAMYDYHTDDILTHAKAYHHFRYQVDFIEPKDEIAEKVISRYGYRRRLFSESELYNYDLVSICTPTETHTKYLLAAIKADVPAVICEKPVAYSIQELDTLISEYETRKTRVLVNYIRRFQQSYELLKQEILKLGEPLQSIHCNYHKGILNSASHAADLVEFLTSFKIDSGNICELQRDYDYFEKDPTVSFAGYQNGVSICFNGLKIDYQIFELDLVFSSYRLCLTDSGKEARIFKRNDLIFHKRDMTKNYMTDVVHKSEELIYDKNCNDNFEDSVALNKTLIKILNN